MGEGEFDLQDGKVVAVSGLAVAQRRVARINLRGAIRDGRINPRRYRCKQAVARRAGGR